MKISKKIFIVLGIVILIATAYFAGRYTKVQEYRSARTERCKTMIHFAINKAQSEDLSDQDIMEALISNVYAAYEYCIDQNLTDRLHNLWNTLIFEGDRYIGSEDELVDQLTSILEELT